MQPTRYKITKLNLAPVFKFVNDLANNTATTVYGDGRVEVNPAVGAVGARKYSSDSALERFGAFLTKRCDDADSFCFALIAEIIASSTASAANCTEMWIEK